MMSLKGLVERLYPFAYGITGAGNDDALEILREELPFEIHSFASGSALNGWEIPHFAKVEKAEIRAGDEVVFDGTDNPLGVAAMSRPFTGKVPKPELLDHISVSAEHPDWTPYHWTYLYRPWERDWHFCMPRQVRDSLGRGPFDVTLEIKEEPRAMKVAEYTLPGTSEETVVINAHNCHSFQANDDISGVAVGIALLKRLATKRRRLTYVLLIAPELHGPMFWLDAMETEAWRRFSGAILLKSVGNERDIRLQESFSGSSRLDKAAHHVLRARLGEYDHGPFRSVYGNDETVFEAPPYRIPSITLTRWPFREYHSDADTPECVSSSALEETLDAAFDICMALEADLPYRPKFNGLVNLSSHGLYKNLPAFDPDAGVDYHQSVSGRWNRLMNSLPQFMDGETRLLDLATEFDLPINEIRDYLEEWECKGLTERVEPDTAAS